MVGVAPPQLGDAAERSARAVERNVFGERRQRALLLPAGVVARQRRQRVEVRQNDVRGAEGGGGEPARAGSDS